jgi:GDP-L-fucose synthase
MPFLDTSAPIFVAGHKGLIGSAVLRRLRQDGFSNILVRDRRQLDLAREEQVWEFFSRERPQVVIMAAGRVGGIMENIRYPAEFILQNLAMQVNVMRSAFAVGVQRFVFFGSSCMYPRECPQPMREDMLFQGRPEDTSLPYAIAKLAGVQTCLALNKQLGETRFLPVIPNSAYGPNDNFDLNSAHVLSALIRRFHEARVNGNDRIVLWGSGKPRREFIHADDIADACVFLLHADLTRVELPLNLGVGQDYSIHELAMLVAEVVGFRGKIAWDTRKPDGAPRKLLDSSRMRALGWRPHVNLREGLSKTYEWFVQHATEVAR